MPKSNNRILIHKKMTSVTLTNSVDIILTPQFYTFLREELELNFSYQAKQIAPSLFDDYLSRKNEYQYYVEKCNNLWCFYAYDIEEIDQFLESVGIEKHRVSKIYFVQQFADILEQPVSLSETDALQTIDDVVTLVPKRFINPTLDLQNLDISQKKLKGGITMGASLNSFVSLKETIALGTLFTILGGIFIMEGNRIGGSIEASDKILMQRLDDNPKYGSSMLRQSILSKYQPIDRLERSKREKLKEISKLLSSKSQLKSLILDDKKITAHITTKSNSINKQVKNHAKLKKFQISGSGFDVKVEQKL